MNLPTRLALLTALLAPLGFAWSWLSAGAKPQDSRSTVRWESSRQCKDCHQDVYAEWESSHHRIAYTNPEVLKLSDDFRKEECLDCHLPRPLSVTGFGKRTLPRRTYFDEGVSCISCHLGADGGILGTRNLPDAPCQPRASAEFASVEACASCHNQHMTTDQWRASHFAKAGVDCSSCHMPATERTRADGSKRAGRGHRWLGAHDTETLRSAGVFTAEQRDGELLLRLHNKGAGHNFPTEERHRAVDLVYRFVDAAGKTSEWQRAWRFRQPYRDEPGENTQLPAGATKEVAVSIPPGSVKAEARMWYRLTPFSVDGDTMSTLLEERAVDLR
jgi:hypothetical protein